MLGVNGKPFEIIDDLIDVEGLKSLHEEIVLGLAMVETFLSEGKEFSRGDACLELYDESFRDVGQAEANLSEPEKDLLKGMTHQERAKYLMYAHGAYYPWQAALGLLRPPHWGQKHTSEGKALAPEAQRWFPRTIEYVYSLPFFRDIGRIAIFGVLPCQHITCHRDLDPAKWPRDDHLVMLSPRGEKPFYVYDEVNRVKHYPDGHACIFNDLDYHGADAMPRFTYNIRVDGVFTPEYEQRFKFGRANDR